MYSEVEKLFNQKRTEINKLKEEEYKQNLPNEIKKWIGEIDFDLANTDTLIAHAEKYGINDTDLKTFKELCENVKKAKSFLENKYLDENSEQMKDISAFFQKHYKTDNVYDNESCKKNTQKYILRQYAQSLFYMRTKKYILDEDLAQICNNCDGMSIEEQIIEFLKTQKIKKCYKKSDTYRKEPIEYTIQY